MKSEDKWSRWGSYLSFAFGIFVIANIIYRVFLAFTEETENGKRARQELTVNMDSFVQAIAFGSDNSGKTKESYILEFERGARVRLINAFVSSKNTNASGTWYIFFTSKPFNAGVLGARLGIPQANVVNCALKSKEEKSILAREFTINSPSVSVVGTIKWFNGDGLFLENCSIISQ